MPGMITSPSRRAAQLLPETVEPLRDPRWRRLVERAPEASVFHHPAWSELLHAQYRYEIFACCVAAPDGRLLAGLPIAAIGSRITGRRLVALPFSDVCEPLVDPAAPPDAAAELSRALDATCRARGAGLEVHGGGRVLADAAQGPRFHHHRLPLDADVAAVARRFRKPQVMRGVRRARREGLTVVRRTDAAALAAFYRLHMATRARLGVPTQPRAFVMRFAELFAQGLGFVLLVGRDGRPCAAAVFLTFGDTLTYKYGASDARQLGARPNNLLFMDAIAWGCAHGFGRLDLGRTDWDHESLRAFKLAWGADEQELSYRRLGPAAPRSRGGALQAGLAAVLRHSPPVASRLAGEVLYRHAG
jgi:CelD/BcsL family acetyltransferase involved in cellulose biosynthesis